MSKRQATIASFFVKKEVPSPKREAIEPTAKRRKVERRSASPAGDRPIPTVLDESYPPPTHPSYHPPPTPTYNHPITIAPIPDLLNSSLAYNTDAKPIVKPDLGLDLLYFKRFIDASCSRQLTEYLLDSLPWYRVKYTVRGININTPRYTTVFGKDATDTPWIGYDKAEPRAIPRILLMLMQKGASCAIKSQLTSVEEVTGETYNFVLVNYYSSGADSISYHSDSESFLGPNPCIASLSLGAPRDFMLRHVDYQANKAPVEKFVLTDGDMVVMRGRTQHDWQHSIPKRANAEGRINITFRKGMVKYATQNYYQYNVGKGNLHRWEGGKMVEKA